MTLKNALRLILIAILINWLREQIEDWQFERQFDDRIEDILENMPVPAQDIYTAQEMDAIDAFFMGDGSDGYPA